MKYLILMYGSQRDYDAMAGSADAGEPAWSAADFAAMGAFMESFGKDLAESGELVDAQGLTAPVHTRRIRLRAGAPVVTGDPYAETAEGVPANPRGWLITVASRRLTDLLRSEQSRRAREEAAARRIPPEEWLAPAATSRPPSRTTR